MYNEKEIANLAAYLLSEFKINELQKEDLLKLYYNHIFREISDHITDNILLNLPPEKSSQFQEIVRSQDKDGATKYLKNNLPFSYEELYNSVIKMYANKFKSLVEAVFPK
jgi:hypothetical protein